MLVFSTFLLCSSTFLSFTSVPLAQAKNVTVVVDDAAADPLTGQRIQYFPADTWKAGKNDDCDGCTAHPNASVAYQSTWHEVEDGPGGANQTKAVFSFEGTSVSVHCLIEGYVPEGDEDLSYDLIFSLDGKTNAGFTTSKIWQSTAQFDNVAVYESEPLQMGNHTLEIRPAAALDVSGDYSRNRSVVILDYIEYTVDSEKLPASITIPATLPPLPSSTNTSASQTSGAPSQTTTSGSLSNVRGGGCGLALGTIVGAGLCIVALLT